MNFFIFFLKFMTFFKVHMTFFKNNCARRVDGESCLFSQGSV